MLSFKFFKNNLLTSLSYLPICMLLFSCAQVVAPSGGKKDTTPPRITKYNPDSASVNFTSKTILMTFDEFIQLKDLNNQLIISPPLIKTPDITVEKKTLSIVFDKNEYLKPNTTYSISFGNSIQDVNENNPIENFKYIFSTGSFIDSLTLKGKVQNGFNLATEKGIVVMLYRDYSDSTVYTGQPDYFSKTNADGTFQINNIKAGKYKLVALKDINANYKYDSGTELIGFVDAPIDVSEKKNILIDLFQEPVKKVFLKKHSHDSYGKITLVFNQGSDSIRVNLLNNDMKGVQEFLEFSKNKDTLVYWVRNFTKDSLIMQVNNGTIILDTLEFKFIQMEDALRSKKNPLKLEVLDSPNGNQVFDLNREFSLKFNHPISSFENKYVPLTEDTIPLNKKASSLHYSIANETVSIVKWDTTLGIKKSEINVAGKFLANWKENTNYHLLILPGTFTDIFGLTNDSIKIDFKTKEEKYYGTVKLSITIPETNTNYIVQLLDEAGNMLRENFITKSQEIKYDYLYPRKYRLKLIYDENNNHKWDTGNYMKHVQPEKVIYNSELINIRSNWDAELEWKVE